MGEASGHTGQENILPEDPQGIPWRLMSVSH